VALGLVLPHTAGRQQRMSEKTPALAKVLRETLLEISSSLGVAARDGNNSHVTGAGTCIGKVVGQLFICGNMTVITAQSVEGIVCATQPYYFI